MQRYTSCTSTTEGSDMMSLVVKLAAAFLTGVYHLYTFNGTDHEMAEIDIQVHIQIHKENRQV